MLGTLAIKLVGTLSGTFDHEIITELGDEAIVMITDDGTLLTCVQATTTGDDQLEGTTTVAGTATKLETATVTTAELGTLAITDVGTDSGIFDQETIATEGLEAKTTTWVAGNELTNEIGTT